MSDISTTNESIITSLNNKADTDLTNTDILDKLNTKANVDFSNIVSTDNTLTFGNRGKIRYDPNKKRFIFQNCLEDGDLDKGPFTMLIDSDKPEDISENPGSYSICGRIDELNKTVLTINPSGTIFKSVCKNSTDMNISIVESVVEVDSTYIRYDSGLQICYQRFDGVASLSTLTVTFPVSFISQPEVIISRRTELNTTNLKSFNIQYIDLSYFKVYIVSGDGVDTNNTGISYIAIGRWK